MRRHWRPVADGAFAQLNVFIDLFIGGVVRFDTGAIRIGQTLNRIIDKAEQAPVFEYVAGCANIRRFRIGKKANRLIEAQQRITLRRYAAFIFHCSRIL
ncbi:MAG: hypothetical protein CVV45_13820 [Spirochaetae bacterium HGW-Spirochaetae-10]|nr:MAG: hypothetical protein CVV45_13820 [Spirochaetae bacterium HGW-Spirochaetae-10]